MTETQPNPPAGQGNGPEQSAFGRAGAKLSRFFQPTWPTAAALAVGTLVMLLALIVVAPAKFRKHVSGLQYTLFSWTLPNELSGGLIRVTAPRVFTRERLVNDRLDEADWLQQRLRDTERLLNDSAFAKPDQVRVERLEMAVEDDNRRAPATSPTNSTPEGTRLSERFVPPELALNQQQQLERANRYRDFLRRRLVSENLDDTHDIEGNTLYRLDMAAAITPPPYSDAVAVVELQVKEQDRESALASYGELLEEWREEIERHATRLYSDRMRILQESEIIPIDQASRELKLDFYEYALDQIIGLLFLDADNHHRPLKLLTENRHAYLRFAEAEINSNLRALLP